jgi:hypothetical protein
MECGLVGNRSKKDAFYCSMTLECFCSIQRMAEKIRRSLGTPGHLKLLKDVVDIVRDRLVRQAEGLCDLFICLPFGQQRENLLPVLSPRPPLPW